MKNTVTKDDILFFFDKSKFDASVFTKEAIVLKDILLSEQSEEPSLYNSKNKKINFSICFEKPKPFIVRSSNYHDNTRDDFFDNFEGKVDKSKLQIFKRNIGLQINSQNSICIYHNKFYDTKKNKDQYEKEISSKKISVDDLFTKGEEALTKSLDEEDDKNLSKDPKVVEIKRIFKVNEYLKVENKKHLWYIYHTAGKSSFGPLTSENIEQMYNSKMLNGESEVRLIDIYGVDEGDNFKYVKLKEVEKSGFIKRICISKQGKNAFEVLMKK